MKSIRDGITGANGVAAVGNRIKRDMGRENENVIDGQTIGLTIDDIEGGGKLIGIAGAVQTGNLIQQVRNITSFSSFQKNNKFV